MSSLDSEISRIKYIELAPKIKAFNRLKELDPSLLTALSMHKKVFGDPAAIGIQIIDTKEIIYKAGNFQAPRSFKVSVPVYNRSGKKWT